MKHLKPRIYVACLAAYNNGYLHGEWIDASQETDGLYREVKKILSASPVPYSDEWAIHDYEDFGDALIHEYTSLETVSEIADYISTHGELGAAVLCHTGNNIEEALKIIEDCYQGEFDSEEDFAYYWTHEVDCRKIPAHLEYYIDYKAMARDFFINDFFSIEIDHKVHVFSYY